MLVWSIPFLAAGTVLGLICFRIVRGNHAKFWNFSFGCLVPLAFGLAAGFLLMSAFSPGSDECGFTPDSMIFLYNGLAVPIIAISTLFLLVRRSEP